MNPGDSMGVGVRNVPGGVPGGATCVSKNTALLPLSDKLSPNMTRLENGTAWAARGESASKGKQSANSQDWISFFIVRLLNNEIVVHAHYRSHARIANRLLRKLEHCLESRMDSSSTAHCPMW